MESPSGRSRPVRSKSEPRESGEFARIARLSRILGAGLKRPHVELDVGDDAAVLAVPGGRLVWTVDAAVDGVHFRRDLLGLEDVGWRSLHAAVSDLAAMGAMPVAALSALTLPRGFPDAELERLVRGQRQAADVLGCPVVGGNLSRGAALSVTTTVLGRAKNPILRGGAQVGDELWLLGEVGLAAAGLAWLMKKRRGGGASAQRCVLAWRRPVARLSFGKALCGRAHAAIDVSDGLAGDAVHMAKRSRVRIAIETPRLVASLSRDLVRIAGLLGEAPERFALAGGEDYALLAAGSPRRRPPGAIRIGTVCQGRGVVLVDAEGRSRVWSGGFDHFAEPR